MKKKLFILIIYFILFDLLQAQDKNISYWESSARFGRIIKSQRSNGRIIRNFMTEGVLGIGVQTIGESYWEEFFNYPRFGLQAVYTNYSNNIFGSSFALYTYLQSDLFRISRFSLNYGIGIGLGWHTKYYDSKKNPLNDYISTRLTTCIDLTLSFEYQISSRIDLFAGSNFFHFSNGATSMPNLGINSLSVYGGMRLYEKPKNSLSFHKGIEKPHFSKNEIYVFFAPSFMKYRKWGNQTFFGSTLELGCNRQFHPCLKWGVGIDLLYTGYEKYEIEESVRSNKNNISQAVFGSFELLFGNISLHVAAGVCTYYSEKPKGIIYERAGIFYNYGKNFKQFSGVSIKAYGAVADYIEWTYGFKIKSF